VTHFIRIALFGVALAACARHPKARGEILSGRQIVESAHRAHAGLETFPAAEWLEGTPESQGLSSARLAEAIEFAKGQGSAVHAIVVVRRGVVVLEAAFYPYAKGSLHDVASITKSVTSMLVGTAARRGLLAANTDVTSLLGASGPPVTTQQLLGMRSGFNCGFGRGEMELEAMKRSEDWVNFTLSLPRRSTPGTEFGYCSPNYHLVSAALSRVSGMSEFDLARRELFEPLGIGSTRWPSDEAGRSHGWGDLQMAPRDLARLGLLMLNDGVWSGARILSEGWVDSTTTPRVKYGANSLYGLGWWSHPDAPPGMFEGIGRGGQRLTIWPAKELVVVMLGGGYDPGPIGAYLLKALIADTAIIADRDGEARLQRALAGAAAAPVFAAPSTSALAPKVTGVRWVVEENPLGLVEAELAFADTSARAILTLRDRRLDLPVGLRGRFELAPTAIDGIRPGTRGRWLNDTTFALEMDLIGKIDRYNLTFSFHGAERATIELVERTGLMRQTLRATPSR
jgi:CubicO group peptidase (beta-lactamase class C family)